MAAPRAVGLFRLSTYLRPRLFEHWVGVQKVVKGKSEFLEPPFGTLELDGAGVVLRYDAAPDQSPRVRPSDVVGRNFFKDIAIVTQLENIEARFNDLVAGDSHSRKSSIFLCFTLPTVRIQLSRTPGVNQSTDGRKGHVLVRIERER